MSEVILTKKVFEYLADTLTPLLNSPTSIAKLANTLESTNPKFDKQKFINRSVSAWERHNDIDG
jgi:hypothetical protein|tara:strand:+ start:4735 stop:4926 length:192 start_codon:yes stop_codon:yes gene_type:complete